jgi:opacity protein-like surface antigen
MNLQQIDIPLGLKLKTEELGYATLFLQVGFNPAFNINARITSDDGDIDKENIQESIRVFNLGYQVGAGVEYRLGGSTAALAGIRWSSWLLDVTPEDAADLTMHAISINLGLIF